MADSAVEPSSLTAAWGGRSNEHQRRIFQQLLQCGEVLRADGPIDYAMIATHADPHAVSRNDFPISVHDRRFFRCADGKSRGLGRIDNGVKSVDAVGAEIGDGDRATLEFIRRKFLAARAGSEVLYGNAQLL